MQFGCQYGYSVNMLSRAIRTNAIPVHHPSIHLPPTPSPAMQMKTQKEGPTKVIISVLQSRYLPPLPPTPPDYT